MNPILFLNSELIYCPGLIRNTDQKKRDVLFFSVDLKAMLRIPNYAIISHTKDSQQHRNWPLFHSVPADAVWIKQQHVCSHTALTVWRHCSSALLSVSVVFVNRCFFCSVNMTIYFCVIWCEGTAVVKESLGMLRAIVTLSYILDYYFMLNMHFAS